MLCCSLMNRLRMVVCVVRLSVLMGLLYIIR